MVCSDDSETRRNTVCLSVSVRLGGAEGGELVGWSSHSDARGGEGEGEGEGEGKSQMSERTHGISQPPRQTTEGLGGQRRFWLSARLHARRRTGRRVGQTRPDRQAVRPARRKSPAAGRVSLATVGREGGKRIVLVLQRLRVFLRVGS